MHYAVHELAQSTRKHLSPYVGIFKLTRVISEVIRYITLH